MKEYIVKINIEIAEGLSLDISVSIDIDYQNDWTYVINDYICIIIKSEIRSENVPGPVAEILFNALSKKIEVEVEKEFNKLIRR